MSWRVVLFLVVFVVAMIAAGTSDYNDRLVQDRVTKEIVSSSSAWLVTR